MMISPDQTMVERMDRNTKAKGTSGKRAKAQDVRVSKKNPYEIVYEVMTVEGVKIAQEILHEEGRLLAAKIQLNILQQLLPFTPLNPQYAAWKRREGLDPRILIANGDYVDSIKARKKVDGSIEVSVPEGKHPQAGISYQILGAVHEYGQVRWQQEGKGIPARPHWRPSVQWWYRKRLDQTVTKMETDIEEAILERLEKQVGNRKYTRT